jgi:hypothetical protein
MGRPIRHSPGEVRGFEERARYMLQVAPEALARSTRREGRASAPDQARAARRRRGRRAVELPLPDGGQCGAAGADRRQCVVLKHSHQTPLCAERFIEAFAAPAFRPACSSTCICRMPTPRA